MIKKLIPALLLASLSCLFNLSLRAQQIIVSPMPFLDKLSINSIFDLYQDSEGFMWLGTTQGLGRYDGYDIQWFTNNYKDPNKLANKDIRCFTEDDTRLWVGTARGISLIDKTSYRITPLADSLLAGREIRDLFRDHRGNIWVTTDRSVFRCDATTASVTREYPLSNYTNTFFEDGAGGLWLLTWGGNILKYDGEADTFSSYAQIAGANPYRMTQDDSGRYWIATWGRGIWRFDPAAERPEDMFEQQRIVNPVRNSPEIVFYDIVQDDTYGYLWALSHFGLYVFRVDENDRLVEVDVNEANNINRPIDRNKTYSRIIKDNSGTLWIAAYDQGHTVAFEKAEIENYTLDQTKRRLGVDANVFYLNKDSRGVIWFDLSRYGLCLFDERTGKITYGTDPTALYSIDVVAIVPSRHGEWVWLAGRGNYSTRVWKMCQTDMTISTLESYNLREVTANPGEIADVVEDDRGNLWIGTSTGLFILMAGADRIVPVTGAMARIGDMSKDNDGNVWICCPDAIFKMRCDDTPAVVATYDRESVPLPGDSFRLITARNGKVWFATSLGRLFHLDPASGEVDEQTDECALEGDNILKLLSRGDKVWIVCDKYIVCHDTIRGDSNIYSVGDANIFVTSFRQKAAFIDSEGSLYAGGHNGFIKISPDRPDTSHTATGKVWVTDVKAAGRSVLFSPGEGEEGNTTRQITLRADARNIEILFSTLSYTSSRRIRYAYRLDGEDKEWTYIDNGRHSAFYNHLRKGDYLLRITATDPYGNQIEQERQLILRRLPAWHETWYAYTLWTVLAAVVAFGLLRIYFGRMERRNSLKLNEELTQVKLNYFTNISHELLTPLTIISCVADELDERQESPKREVEILRGNVDRLTRLLQQILDFRKMESGGMRLKVSKSDISAYTAGVAGSSFEALARKKNIELTSTIEPGIRGYLDIDKFDKVLFNLLSNAVKYTPEHKKIHVTLGLDSREGQRLLVLRVKDEGIGIAENNIGKIFTKFYNNPGHPGYDSNGIGLALTKELVTLHRGTIEVSSEVGRGSTFTVEIPIDKEAYDKSEIMDASTEILNEPALDTDGGEDKYCILFIDDNAELRELIQRILGKKYKTFTAESGLEGLEVLRDNPVDIIVCDVMMPQIDGLEFCRQVKGDLKTNHIPIIMLTARNTPDDQIECYKAGAEGYISKPFEMKILQARIDNLLEAQALRRQSFRSKMEVNISNLDYRNPDEAFLNDAIRCVEQHIRESDFDIVKMASELNISRSTLSRKLKVIIGCTPLEFVHNIKLKYACAMLKNRSAHISEIAYATGFSSPKYFSKCFKEEFNMTPTEYQNRQDRESSAG